MDDDGAVAIPSDLLAKLAWRSGDVLTVRLMGTQLVFEAAPTALRSAQDRFKVVAPGTSLADELIAERRRDVDTNRPTDR
jgi:hypothetical protein